MILRKISRQVENIIIDDVSNLKTLRQRKIKIGIIIVPCEATQETFDKLVSVGIKCILSFSPYYSRKKIKAITIYITVDLIRPPYYIATRPITSL
jgi:redox-sensing transcriptional repressor